MNPAEGATPPRPRPRRWSRAATAAVVSLLVVAGVGPAGARARSVAAPPPGGSISWLAMGDSYSSGEGDINTDPKDRCQRADGVAPRAKAWPVAARDQVAASGLQVNRFDFVACTGNITNDWRSQFAEVGSRRADLVTYTFGGNNLGFADVLYGCIGANVAAAAGAYVSGALTFVGWDAPWQGCSVPENELTARIDKWAGKPSNSTHDTGLSLPDLLSGVATDAVTPGGKIVVVGYPQLFEESGRWPTWSNRCERVRRSDANMLRGVIANTNQTIRTAVEQASGKHNGVEIAFVDAAPVFEGQDGRHGLCSDQPWINGLAVLADGRKERAFHPTPQGHAALGTAVAGRVAQLDLSTLRPCEPDLLYQAAAQKEGFSADDPSYRTAANPEGPVATGARCVGDWAVAGISRPNVGTTDGFTLFRWADGRWNDLTGPLDPPNDTCQLIDKGVPADIATVLQAPETPGIDINTFCANRPPEDTRPPATTTTTKPRSGTGGAIGGAPGGAPPPGPTPVLGRNTGPYQEGFGTPRPSRVYFGGVSSGSVDSITWDDWGGETARGNGTGFYVAPGAIQADNQESPAKIVAFDLGDCGGTLAYRKITWYFPAFGETFDPANANDICDG